MHHAAGVQVQDGAEDLRVRSTPRSGRRTGLSAWKPIRTVSVRWMVGCIAGSSPLGIFVRSCKKWRGPHWTLFYLPKHLQLRLDLILFNEVLQCLTGRFTGSHWTCRESNSGATSRHLVQIIKKVVQQLQQSPRRDIKVNKVNNQERLHK